MSEAIKNRYEFVVLFDGRTVIPMEILMRAICQESIQRADWAW